MRERARGDYDRPSGTAIIPVGAVKMLEGKAQGFSVMARSSGNITLELPQSPTRKLFEATPDECERIAYAFIKAAAEARRAGDGKAD
jgi:hypothetical protein